MNDTGMSVRNIGDMGASSPVWGIVYRFDKQYPDSKKNLNSTPIVQRGGVWTFDYAPPLSKESDMSDPQTDPDWDLSRIEYTGKDDSKQPDRSAMEQENDGEGDGK